MAKSAMIKIRPCRASDSKFLWGLRNEKGVRGSAFSGGRVVYKRHMEWFEKKLADDKSRIFIVKRNGRRIGQVRLDKARGSSAEVDVAIIKKSRGRGLGTAALRKVSFYAFKELGVKKLIAHVKEKNTPSIAAFEKAGFSKMDRCRVKGQKAHKLVMAAGRTCWGQVSPTSYDVEKTPSFNDV